MPYSDIEAKSIQSLCTIVDCEHKTAPYVDKSEFLVVRTSNVRNGQLIMDDMKYTTQAGYDEWTQRAVPIHGDVLFTREAPAGESCLVPRELKVCMGQRMVMLRPKTEKVDPVFLSLVLATEKCKSDISRLSIGSTVSRINISDIKKLRVPSPPLPEQKKIAQTLSTWDKAITTTEQLLANSQQQKKALMQQLLTGKKRLLDKNGVRFSGEWKITTLSQMGKVVSGGTPDTNTKEYWDGDIHWLTPTDVTALKSRFVRATTRTISEAGVQNSSATILPAGSLMVCTRATIGALSISSGPICTNQGFKNIIPTKAFDVNFIYYLLAYNSIALLRKASGSTFLELSKKDFEKMEFPCPLLEEQQKIAAVLSTADEEITALQQKLDALKQEKKALMQQLLTGKRRVLV
ncbi:MAG: restriction endonuclease subunit S [Proteus vulgaris]|uniref:restriction endonuclease subunit S n=1 Tax=Gammaproteobacteria TaxID=1236 RepID=UPI000EA0ADC5|nr:MULTISPECIES: restriction endonuclease subunit S [Gammaproteobacteria]MBI6512979.1 restriction endonuclease subunit S [Proteus sp. PR00174]